MSTSSLPNQAPSPPNPVPDIEAFLGNEARQAFANIPRSPPANSSSESPGNNHTKDAAPANTPAKTDSRLPSISQFLNTHEHLDYLNRPKHPDPVTSHQTLPSISRFLDTSEHQVYLGREKKSTVASPVSDPILSEQAVGMVVGDYLLDQRIGVGGMGTVFKARRSSDNLPVAIKILNKGSLSTDVEVRRFRHEIRSLARLQHPHICRLLDFGRHGQLDYLVMEYIEGDSLVRWLQRDLPSFQDIAKMLAKVARALAYAHACNVIHRDINPSNIMVSKGEPILMDFGLAAEVTSGVQRLTVSGMAVGTPQYMSPEQTYGRASEINESADIWAVGATLYYCLCERPPFDGATVQDIYNLINNTSPLPPSRHNPSIPKPLERITLRCLQFRVGDRYAHATDLALDLDLFAGGKRINVQLPGPLRVVARRVQRRPLPYLLGTGIIVVLCALLLTMWIQHQRQWGNWVAVYDFQFGPEYRHQRLPTETLRTYSGDLRQELGLRLDENGFPRIVSEYEGALSGWLWFEHPDLTNVARYELLVEVDSAVDAIDLAIGTTNNPLTAWWHFPRGWSAKLGMVWPEGNASRWQMSRLSESGGLNEDSTFALIAADSPILNRGNFLHLDIIREVDSLTMTVNGHTTYSFSDPGAVVLRGGGLGIRFYRQETKLHVLRAHRRTLSQSNQPEVIPDFLAGTGNIELAIKQYLDIAKDFPDSIHQERALARALALGLEHEKLTLSESENLLNQLESLFPQSNYLQSLHEKLCATYLSQGAYHRSRMLMETIFQRWPNSTIALILNGKRINAFRGQQLDILTQRLIATQARYLSMRDMGLTDVAAFSDHSKRTLLSNLELDGNKLTSVDGLTQLPSLTRLSLARNQISHITGHFKSLKYAAISWNSALTDLAAFSPSPLIHLSAANTAISSLPRDHQWANTLQILDLGSTPFTTFDQLTEFNDLISLNLSDTTINSLAPLQKLPLKQLDISKTAITDFLPLADNHWTQLSLSLDQADLQILPLTGATVHLHGPILNPELLTHFDFKHVILSDADILNLTPLNGTSIHTLQAGGGMLQQLFSAPVPNLQDLDVSNNRLTEISDDQARHLPNLRRLLLHDNPLSAFVWPADLPSTPMVSLSMGQLTGDTSLAIGQQLLARGDTKQAHPFLCLHYLQNDMAPLLRGLATRHGASSFVHVPIWVAPDEAQKIARDAGGRLANIPNSSANVALQALMQPFPHAFIGATMGADNALTWNDGERQGYTNLSHSSLFHADRLVVINQNGHWNTEQVRSGFIIEWPDPPN